MMSDIRFYLLILLRRLPLVILIVTLTTGAAILYAMSLPRSYTSSARLLVEAPQVTEGLSSSTVGTAPMTMMNLVQQKVMARDSLIALAERQDLGPFPGLTEPEIARIVGSSITIRNASPSLGELNVLTSVSVDASTAQQAAAVAQDVVDQIVHESARQRTSVASGTLSFITTEVERLAAELDQRSQAIIDFQSAHADALPSGLGYREGRRAALETDLAAATAELQGMADQERNIRAIAMGGTDGGILQTQLEELRTELAAARLVFSETNPRVTRLVAREAQLVEQMGAAAETAPSDASSDSTGNALADMQLADLNRRRAALEERVPALRAELADLTRAIDATPANASALAVLERELDAAQTRYAEARDRLVLAQNGERLELSDQTQRITVLEAPTVPAWPSKPSRKLIAAAGMAAGLGLSFGLLVLLELMGGRVRRSSDLAQALDITPIVTIPRLPKTARG